MRAVLLVACALVAAAMLAESAPILDDTFISRLIARLGDDEPRDSADATNRLYLIQLVQKALRNKAERTGDWESSNVLSAQLAQMQLRWQKMSTQPTEVAPMNGAAVASVADPSTMQHSLVVLNALLKKQLSNRTL